MRPSQLADLAPALWMTVYSNSCSLSSHFVILAPLGRLSFRHCSAWQSLRTTKGLSRK